MSAVSGLHSTALACIKYQPKTSDRRSIRRLERVREHPISYLSSLRDTFSLVIRPVDTQVDSALTVLLFCLRQRSKASRKKRADIAFVVSGRAVEFIRHKREGNIVRSV